jgi:hypothetical protein
MPLFRTAPRKSPVNKGYLRTRRPKPRNEVKEPAWMDANWYAARNELRNRFEALRTGEYHVDQVLNQNWMTPTSWYAHKNSLRERFASVFHDEESH